MKTVLPDKSSFRVEIIDRKTRLARWSYTETFSDPDVMARTVEIVRQKLAAAGGTMAIRLSKDRRTVRLSGTNDYRDVASMVVSEFLIWSALADMTFRDLFGSAVAFGAGGPSIADAELAKLLEAP